MNENYKWKGITFNSMGVVIEETPIMPKPKNNFTQYTIPGRNGFLAIDNKTYNSIPFTLKCHYNSENANRDEIAAWLDGYGTLQIDGEKEYTGFISNTIPFEKVVRFRKFPVQFMLQPIAKALETTTINALGVDDFDSDTFVETYPIITITGTGDISFSINNINFTIYEASGTYILDCEAKIITKNGINQSMNMSGDFPYIVNGNNSIVKSGNITAVSIEYKQTFI